MIRPALVIALVGVAVLACTVPALAQPSARSTPDQRSGGAPSLKTLKKLIGDWVKVGEDGKPTTQIVSRIRPTAGGTALVDVLYPGTEHEMLTVFHEDGGKLMLTHYCALGNQPRMRARRGRDASTIVFECFDATNTRSLQDKHIHKGTLHLDSPDRIRSEWEMTEGGKVVYAPKFALMRSSKSADLPLPPYAGPNAHASAKPLHPIAKLAGDWVSVDENDKPGDKTTLSMRLTAGGSAVVETLFPGSPQEMTSVYHTDGPDLVLTHYCMMGNQPRLRAVGGAVDARVSFELADITNLDPRRPKFMSGAVFDLGPSRLLVKWRCTEGDKSSAIPPMEFARRQ